MNIERDHLIHRKRSPFPYEGKDLTPDKVGLIATVRRTTSRSAKGSGCAVHLIHRGAVPLPLKGKDNSALQGGRDL